MAYSPNKVYFWFARHRIWVYYVVMLEKGFVQVYTGDGKGKTTAAFGLALRAAGQGEKVLICQFLKPETLELGERSSMAKISGVTVEALDIPWDMRISPEDIEMVNKARTVIKKTIAKTIIVAEEKSFDVIILDEIVFCLSKDLVEFDDVKKLIDSRDNRVELVLTGRGASDELINLADLVTEFKAVKHYFNKGVDARKGIEF